MNYHIPILTSFKHKIKKYFPKSGEPKISKMHVRFSPLLNILHDSYLNISVPPPTTTERTDPCRQSPCGLNALCTSRNGLASCTCREDYFGDPYLACRPECSVNQDCPPTKACQNLHCLDPCPGAGCGSNAQCKVINHIPTCTCPEGYQGEPFSSCRLQPLSKN